ncbi:MAG: hypothetical protein PHI63_03470 [Patescibacteria group bacterium]|nr:hypothetical protein [Patescibacteria group bacterium]
MTFVELFDQVRIEVGPGDQTEALLWAIEEGLNDHFSTDPGWKNEPVRPPVARLYQAVLTALGGVLRHVDATNTKVVEGAKEVAESFRAIINRTLRASLESQPIRVARRAEAKPEPPAQVRRTSRRRTA